MFLTVVRKELLANILTYKFLTGFILCVVLIVFSSYLLTKSYEERLRNYNDSVKKHQAELRTAMVYSEVRPTLDKQPESLSIFCEGFDGKLGNTVSIRIGEVPREAKGHERRDNIFLVSPSLDFVSIVAVILSLFALLASYDAISGENEDGTLRLMLSNAISRDTILMGKYVGGMLSLIPSLLCSFILALLVMQTSPSVALSGADYLRLGLIVGLSLVYISACFCFGLFVSSRTKHSSTSLVFALFFWVMAVFIYPNASNYLAGKLRPIDSQRKVDIQRLNIEQEFARKYHDFWEKHRPSNPWQLATYNSEGVSSWHKSDLVTTRMRTINGAKEGMLFGAQMVKWGEKLRIQYADKVFDLYQRYFRTLSQQASLAQNIARLSPASHYLFASSAIAKTDLKNYLSFLQQARLYREELIQYLYSKDAFGLTWFTRMKAEQLLEAEKLKQKSREEQIPYSWDEIEPLDLSDCPQFQYVSFGIVESFSLAWLDFVLLFGFNVLFFMAAYLSFLKYET